MSIPAIIAADRSGWVGKGCVPGSDCAKATTGASSARKSEVRRVEFIAGGGRGMRECVAASFSQVQFWRTRFCDPHRSAGKPSSPFCTPVFSKLDTPLPDLFATRRLSHGSINAPQQSRHETTVSHFSRNHIFGATSRSSGGVVRRAGLFFGDTGGAPASGAGGVEVLRGVRPGRVWGATRRPALGQAGSGLEGVRRAGAFKNSDPWRHLSAEPVWGADRGGACASGGDGACAEDSEGRRVPGGSHGSRRPRFR